MIDHENLVGDLAFCFCLHMGTTSCKVRVPCPESKRTRSNDTASSVLFPERHSRVAGAVEKRIIARTLLPSSSAACKITACKSQSIQ